MNTRITPSTWGNALFVAITIRTVDEVSSQYFTGMITWLLLFAALILAADYAIRVEYWLLAEKERKL